MNRRNDGDSGLIGHRNRFRNATRSGRPRRRSSQLAIRPTDPRPSSIRAERGAVEPLLYGGGVQSALRGWGVTISTVEDVVRRGPRRPSKD